MALRIPSGFSWPTHIHLPGTVMDFDFDRNTKTNFKNSIEHLIRETPSKVIAVTQMQKSDPDTGKLFVSVRMSV